MGYKWSKDINHILNSIYLHDRYASVNAMTRVEQSRRDDLISLGYVLVYLSTGKLPWLNQQGEDRSDVYSVIIQYKRYYANADKLCEVSVCV